MLAMGFALCRLLDPYTPGGEPFHLGVALCLFLETINTRIDFVMILKRTHTPLRPLGDFTTSRAPLPGRPQITLIVIWAFFTQDVTSLA